MVCHGLIGSFRLIRIWLKTFLCGKTTLDRFARIEQTDLIIDGKHLFSHRLLFPASESELLKFLAQFFFFISSLLRISIVSYVPNSSVCVVFSWSFLKCLKKDPDTILNTRLKFVFFFKRKSELIQNKS